MLVYKCHRVGTVDKYWLKIFRISDSKDGTLKY